MAIQDSMNSCLSSTSSSLFTLTFYKKYLQFNNNVQNNSNSFRGNNRFPIQLPFKTSQAYTCRISLEVFSLVNHIHS